MDRPRLLDGTSRELAELNEADVSPARAQPVEPTKYLVVHPMFNPDK